MTAPRVGCASRPLYRDHHLAVGAWYTLTTPDGTVYEFCSGACLLYFAIYGALPADIEAGGRPGTPMHAGNAHDEGEAA